MHEQHNPNHNNGGNTMSGTKGGKQENDKKGAFEAVAQNGMLAAGSGAFAAGATAAVIGGPTTVTTVGPLVAWLGGPLTTLVGWLGVPVITTAPVWAVPVAVAGGAAALGAVGWKLCRRHGARKDGEKNAGTPE